MAPTENNWFYHDGIDSWFIVTPKNEGIFRIAKLEDKPMEEEQRDRCRLCGELTNSPDQFLLEGRLLENLGTSDYALFCRPEHLYEWLGETIIRPRQEFRSGRGKQ